LAGPLKTAHSDISYLIWLMGEIADGDYNQRLNVSNDLSEAFNRMVEYLVNLSLHDKVTGLLNWEGFRKGTEEKLHAAAQTGGQYFVMSLSIKDIDHYTVLYNSVERDSLLGRVAAFLMGLCHDEELCARYHDDDFLCLLWAENAQKAAQRVDRRRRYRMEYQGDVVPCFRIGIYPVTAQAGLSVAQMCNRAAFAAYGISKYGASDFAVFNGKLEKEYDWQNNIMARFKQALVNHEFKPFYQPKVDVATGRTVSCESLVRWFRPDGSMVMPAKFIGIFEQNGAITLLNFYMLRQVCCHLAERMARHRKVVPISINFSREDLRDKHFVENIAAVANEYGIDPSLLEIEITETAFSEHTDEVLGIVRRLHAAGFTVSMDDFGSGFSSLNMLKNIPVDILKIDQLFFVDFGTDKRAQLLLKDIFSMARHMKLQTVAEGVETREETAFLRKNGCDYIQGFYFYEASLLCVGKKAIR
jgi:EAL domain-containing protein (putative c-di-GMP-specific phosphodiesterase class I)/GGDEF domain-containing protein